MKRTHTRPFGRHAAAAFALMLTAFGAAPVSAAVFSWGTGGAGGDGTWNTTTTNWWNGSSNVAWTVTSNTATFAGTAGTVTIGTALTTAGLSFNTTGYTLAGSSTLTLASASSASVPTLVTASGVTATISAPLKITNLNSSGNFTPNIAATSTLVISGNLSGSSASSYFLVLNTGGTLVLSASNSYSGHILMRGGTLVLNNARSLSTGYINFNSNLGGENRIDNTSGASVTLASTNGHTFGTDITFLGSNNLSFGTGNISLSGTSRTVTVVTNTLTLGGVISGTGASLVKAGDGTLVLSGANTYGTGGSTTITGGILQLAGGANRLPTGASLVINGGATAAGTLDLNGQNQTVAGLSGAAGAVAGVVTNNGTGTSNFTVSTAADSTFAGSIKDGAGGGIVRLIKSGTATLYLTGTNSYSDPTQVTGGVLVFGSTAAITGTAARPVVVTSPGAVVLQGASDPSALLAKINAASTGALALDTNSSTDLDFNTPGLATLSLGAFGGNVTYSGALTPYTGTYRLGGGGGTLTVSSALTGANRLEITGTSKVTLSGSNSYSGATVVNTGATLQLANSSAIAASSTLQLSASSVLQLRSDSSASFAPVNTTTIASGTVTIDVNQSASGTNQTLSLGNVNFAAGGTLNVTGGNGYGLSLGAIAFGTSSGTATFNTASADLTTGNISSSVNANITKTGTGTWTLAGTMNLNGYPAALNINAGTLKMSVANSWATTGGGTSLNVNGGVFDLNGYNQTTARMVGTGGTITNSSTTPAILAIDTKNGQTTSTYAGSITDNGANGGTLGLSIYPANNTASPVTLTLTSASSTYTGVTKVSGLVEGYTTDTITTLLVSYLADAGSASSIGAAGSAATNLVLDSFGMLKYTGTGASTNRLFSIGGNYGSMINASGSGAVSFTNPGTIGFNSSTSARYLALTGTNTGSNSMAATIADNTGATSLTKAGVGTWQITNAANTYTGTTVVGGGVLNVASLANGGENSSIGAATAAAAKLILAGGTLQYTGTSDQSTDRLFTIGATGATLDSSGDGIMNFTSTGAIVSSDPASRTVRIYNSTTTVPIVRTGMLAADLVAGMSVTGSGVTAGTTITSVTDTGIILSSTLVGNKLFTLSFGTVDRALSLTGSNTGLNNISGSLGDSAGSKLSVAKSGVGTWVLAGANSYTGGTVVSDGTLKAGSGNAFGSGVITLSGGVLDLSSYNVGNVINITGTTASVLLQTSSEALVTNFAAGSNFRGWQRRSGLGNNTLATLLGGAADSVATMTTSWSASTDSSKIASDVLDIKGIGGTTFVLQMNYADTGNGDTWENDNVYLGWLNGSSQWVNAVDGNSGGTPAQYFGAYDSSYGLGSWGVDSVNNVVWAVVNHNSEFGVVVPEPAMLALLGLGGLALLRRRRNG